MSRVIRSGARVSVGRRANHWVRVGLLVAGIWLTVAPYALGYAAKGTPLAATVNDTVIGVAVVGLALFSLLVPGPSPHGRGRKPGRRVDVW
jgi:SPW repeat